VAGSSSSVDRKYPMRMTATVPGVRRVNPRRTYSAPPSASVSGAAVTSPRR
jgi:hypothetical protein